MWTTSEINDLVVVVHELREALNEERRARAHAEAWNAQLRMALHAMLIDGNEECQRKAARALMRLVIT